MTLVVVAADDDAGLPRPPRPCDALGGHHPARIVLLRPEPDQVAAGVDARAALYAIRATTATRSPSRRSRWIVGGQAARHLDSIIEPFTLSDLPVVVWYPGDAPRRRPTRCCRSPTPSLVDSRDDRPTRAGSRPLLELARRRTVVDLSWVRLRPWRELLAGLFDARAYRPFVAGGRVRSRCAASPAPGSCSAAGWCPGCGLRPRPRSACVDARHVADPACTAGRGGERRPRSRSAGATVRAGSSGPGRSPRRTRAEARSHRTTPLPIALADDPARLRRSAGRARPTCSRDRGLGAGPGPPAQPRASAPVSVLAVNGELLVVDDLPGAFAGRGHRRPSSAARTTCSAWPCPAATRPGPATSGWPPTSAERDRLAGPSTSTGATSGACRRTTPTPTSSWSARPCWSGSGPPTPSTRCAARRARTPTSCGSARSASSTSSTSAWVPTATPPSLFPDSPALDADPGQLVTLNEDPSGRNPHCPDDAHLSPGSPGPGWSSSPWRAKPSGPCLQALVDGADLPAARVTADRVIWLVDRAAAPR